MSVSRACGSLAMNLSREMRSLQAALITFASSYTLTLKISRLLSESPEGAHGAPHRVAEWMPYYLADLFASVLPRVRGPSVFFCHIPWRQAHSGHIGRKWAKRSRHVMWQNRLHPCAVFTETSGGFAPHYLDSCPLLVIVEREILSNSACPPRRGGRAPVASGCLPPCTTSARTV